MDRRAFDNLDMYMKWLLLTPDEESEDVALLVSYMPLSACQCQSLNQSAMLRTMRSRLPWS